MSGWKKSLLHKLRASVKHHTFKNHRSMKHLVYATALGGALAMAMVSSPSAIAGPGNGIPQRVNELEAKVGELKAKDEIRATLHAFVAALNSAFISGATNPLGPIAAALHPEIVLSATPPPTPMDPTPVPMVFTGRNAVIGGYGMVVVVMTKPNILVSAMDVQLPSEDTAEADLRFANSVNFPAGCTLGTTGCAQVMLFADVHVTFELSDEDVWQVTSVNLVHYLAHGGPPPMMP